METVTVSIVKRGERPPFDVDGVIIATPISTHAELALPYIERGIPVCIEKPVAGSVNDAQRLFDAAEKTNALVHVGHIHLHNPAFVKAKELLPALGQLRYLYFEGMNNGPFRTDASVLWDWLPHPLSMTLNLLGKLPRSVQAWGVQSLHPHNSALSDVGVVKYEFETGVALLCVVNWFAPEKRTALSIVGETSSLVYTDTAPKKIAWYQGMGPSISHEAVLHHVPTITYPPYEAVAPLEVELSAFVRAIERGSHEHSELALGVTIVELIAAAEKSIATGGNSIILT